MIHYVTVPAPFDVIDPVEDTPTGERIPFAKTIRMVTTMMAQLGLADTLDLLQLRQSCDKAVEGHVVEFGDIYDAMVRFIKRPTGMTAAFVLSAQEHFRVITVATTTRPAVLSDQAASS